MKLCESLAGEDETISACQPNHPMIESPSVITPQVAHNGLGHFHTKPKKAQNCKLHPEGALPGGSVVLLNSAGLWASGNYSTSDDPWTRKRYPNPEIRVKCGKDARHAWKSSVSQHKQQAMPKSVCASAGEWVRTHFRQGTNFKCLSPAQCSRGTNQSRRNPARSLKIMASAGHCTKRSAAVDGLSLRLKDRGRPVIHTAFHAGQTKEALDPVLSQHDTTLTGATDFVLCQSPPCPRVQE